MLALGPIVSLSLAFLPAATPPATAPATQAVVINGVSYGAEADELGPIGGGTGYQRIVTRGDFTARTLDELLEALKQARSGQVVFIPGEVEIDCTARVYIEQLVLEIPGGVTLAGDRGVEGSAGARICSDALATPVLLRAMGPKVRVTGLRITGPNPKQYLEHHRRAFVEGRGREYYYKFPTSRGITTEYPELEVDNCEISAFSAAGVMLAKGTGHHVHHCFIHHCQYNGLGYGVCHAAASSLIERNLFDFNRHSIAGTGVPGCGYEARHNVHQAASLSHCFDMHGGSDRKDGTDIAGTRILIHHNTFHAPKIAVKIRGVPEEICDVHSNWFCGGLDAAKTVVGGERTRAHDNAWLEKGRSTVR